MILNAIGVVVLLWIARRFARRLYDGDVALIYIMWYGAVRTALESFRNETGNWHILGIPTAMWIGIIGFIVAGAFLVIRHQRGWGTPGAWIDQEPSEPDDDDASRPHATEPSTG
jgi:prolipoprotein diacylglyceryltransferase